MPKIIRILRSCSMKIFCTFPTINISKRYYWLVICIAKNFIWTTLKMIFSIFVFLPDFPIVISRSNPNKKYINATLIYSAFRWCINLKFLKNWPFWLVLLFRVTCTKILSQQDHEHEMTHMMANCIWFLHQGCEVQAAARRSPDRDTSEPATRLCETNRNTGTLGWPRSRRPRPATAPPERPEPRARLQTARSRPRPPAARPRSGAPGRPEPPFWRRRTPWGGFGRSRGTGPRERTDSGAPEPCEAPASGYDSATDAPPARRDERPGEEDPAGTASDPPDPAADSTPADEPAPNHPAAAPERDNTQATIMRSIILLITTTTILFIFIFHCKITSNT